MVVEPFGNRSPVILKACRRSMTNNVLEYDDSVNFFLSIKRYQNVCCIVFLSNHNGTTWSSG